jgi:hypothetical protein
MKKFLALSVFAAAGLLIANSGSAQVYVNARIGFPVRGPRLYVAPPPVVYQTPAPVYQEPAPVYQQPYAEDQVAYDDPYGYAYYDYPAWNGHYRDYYYYAHYRPFFERRYAGYFNGGRFDRGRFAHENFNRRHANNGYANRSYGNRGNAFPHGSVNRGDFGNRGDGRGWGRR